ncbi:hypothetical protein [Pedobacter miscanthi]|uniref:Uncharacterized protein n=1 Tax=Pedobacter miscanthi TaxID=2259170 RepID=A0A366KNX9_9SPHI|nr:hypothetical protein [Pedobacter miscanthi]RBQ03345.1 hypothetical protein DRW42_22480 [Pedobacter miscanthi]
MNKVVIFLLFPIIVFNASIREVIKVPQLISHFIQHHQIDSQISFIDFLEMHYLGHDLNDNDDEEDMKLPFKKIDGHHVISNAVPAEKFILLKAACLNLLPVSTFNHQPVYNNPTFGSLFRPPIASV